MPAWEMGVTAFLLFSSLVGLVQGMWGPRRPPAEPPAIVQPAEVFPAVMVIPVERPAERLAPGESP